MGRAYKGPLQGRPLSAFYGEAFLAITGGPLRFPEGPLRGRSSELMRRHGQAQMGGNPGPSFGAAKANLYGEAFCEGALLREAPYEEALLWGGPFTARLFCASVSM